jgi:hypothetical protein
MLDAQQSNPTPEPNPEDNTAEPIPYIYSAVQFQDNLTGEWHRVFLNDMRVYLEIAPYTEIEDSGGRTGRAPGRPLEPAPGSDAVLLEPADNILLDSTTGALTTVK